MKVEVTSLIHLFSVIDRMVDGSGITEKKKPAVKRMVKEFAKTAHDVGRNSHATMETNEAAF